MEVLHKSIEERDERFQEAQTIAKAGTTNQPNDDLQTLINERFDKIEENIDHLISTKRAENMQTMEVKDVGARIDAAIHQNISYATTLQTALETSNLTNIIKESKMKNGSINNCGNFDLQISLYTVSWKNRTIIWISRDRTKNSLPHFSIQLD